MQTIYCIFSGHFRLIFGQKNHIYNGLDIRIYKKVTTIVVFTTLACFLLYELDSQLKRGDY